MTNDLPSKHPDNIEPYFVVWCDLATGLNDGSKNDRGELKGATITASVWEVLSGDVEIDDDNTSAVTINGVSYAINTVATAIVSAGTDKTDSRLKNTITTNDSRTLAREIVIPVRSKLC